MSEDPRFTCRRLGHVPTVKNMKWTWTGPLSFICPCARCGEMVEFPGDASSQERET